MSEEIDPNKFTIKELVKIIYKDVKEIKETMIDLDDRTIALETWKTVVETKWSVKKRMYNFIIVFIGGLLAFFNILHLFDAI